MVTAWAPCVVWAQGRDDCGSAAVGLHSKSAVFDRHVRRDRLVGPGRGAPDT
jgi:hypothetical protein